MTDQVRDGNAREALAALERHPRKNDALYQLERGMLLRLVGRYHDSNTAFDKADRINEDLYTRSISRQAAALVVSDRIGPYRLPLHEQLLMHEYEARNYLDLGDLPGALVEARGIERILVTAEDDGTEQPYGAELGYLMSALIYEAGNEPEDALRMYRRLVALRQDVSFLPGWARVRMRRLAAQTGFELPATDGCEDEGSAAGSDSSGSTVGYGARADSTLSTVVVFLDRGLVPTIQEMRMDVPILESDVEEDSRPSAVMVRDRVLAMRRHDIDSGDLDIDTDDLDIAYWLTIAIPFYAPEPEAAGRIRIETEGADEESGHCADMLVLAEAALAREMPGIMLRTAMRAIAKYGIHEGVEKKGGWLAGALANIAGSATEQAETRSWSTLPREITVIAVDAPRSVRRLTLSGASGEADRREDVPVIFRRGEGFAFVSYRF